MLKNGWQGVNSTTTSFKSRKKFLEEFGGKNGRWLGVRTAVRVSKVRLIQPWTWSTLEEWVKKLYGHGIFFLALDYYNLLVELYWRKRSRKTSPALQATNHTSLSCIDCLWA